MSVQINFWPRSSSWDLRSTSPILNRTSGVTKTQVFFTVLDFFFVIFRIQVFCHCYQCNFVRFLFIIPLQSLSWVLYTVYYESPQVFLRLVRYAYYNDVRNVDLFRVISQGLKNYFFNLNSTILRCFVLVFWRNSNYFWNKLTNTEIR